MKTGITICLVLMLGINVATATITSVQIIPAEPTLTDSISILVNGIEGSSPVQIMNTQFSVNGNSLALDIYLDLGFAFVLTPWSHTEVIGTLPTGDYNLTVRRLLPSYYPPDTIVSSYSTSFEVVPEPCTVVFLGFGLPLLKAFSKRKS
jgi:hypothetical protein